MRLLLLLGWLLLGAGLAVWYRGPGQGLAKLDEAGTALAQGDGHAAEKRWAEAIEAYDEALGLLPGEQVEAARRIRLEKAKAQMKNRQLAKAHEGLKGLCGEMQADTGADRALLAEARSALAQTHYYKTWALRLGGAPSEVWEPEIETARQIYRLLAEQAGERGDESSRLRRLEDLETAVRLARLDLEVLVQAGAPGEIGGAGGRGTPTTPKPDKAQDARGASAGPPPDTGGH